MKPFARQSNVFHAIIEAVHMLDQGDDKSRNDVLALVRTDYLQ